MKKILTIVATNITHSQDKKVSKCHTDEEWVATIQTHLNNGEPIYVQPCLTNEYLHTHFIEQTLTSSGYIISGDYETTTPELGTVVYRIWSELGDYWRSFDSSIAKNT